MQKDKNLARRRFGAMIHLTGTPTRCDIADLGIHSPRHGDGLIGTSPVAYDDLISAFTERGANGASDSALLVEGGNDDTNPGHLRVLPSHSVSIRIMEHCRLQVAVPKKPSRVKFSLWSLQPLGNRLPDKELG
jgi:hypothetical protein